MIRRQHRLRLPKLFCICASFGFALATDPASATATFANGYSGTVAEVNSTTQFTYGGDVSTNDLLAAVATPNYVGWNNALSANDFELDDGIHGDNNANVSGAWTNPGATATYVLGLGTNGLGFNVTSINSIADWSGAAFGNQAWTLAVQLAGGGSFVDVATVNYQPLATVGATKATLSNLNITGIQALRVTAINVNGGANSGRFVWRELDAIGTSTTPVTDDILPLVSSLAPANAASGVPANANLVATFSENIALSTGNITIKNLDGASQTVITLPDARVSVSGAVLTINPDINLASGTRYAVLIDPTAIDDMSGNSFVGIAGDTTWNFTTGVPDLNAPTTVALSPADNATNVPLASNLVATFGESITLGTGSITIKNLDAASQTVITLPDARVTASGAVLTINPNPDLSASTNYAVRIGSTAITDLSGNPFVGIADDVAWNFKTAARPLRIVCMGDSITTGYTDNPNWANHPFKFGYRSRLYNLLTSTRRYDFRLVGGSTEPWTGISGDPTKGGTYKPAFDLRDIGQDGHRGYGGQSAGFLNNNILTWLASDDPDIILLKIGTNSQDQTGLDTLVNTITTTKPNLHLIIAQIMPKYSYQQGIVNYNTYIRDTLVPKYQGLGKKVTLVDQYAPFLTNPASLTSINQSLFSNGINHPDNVGYDKMADVWFAGIEALGIAPVTFLSYITNPSFGLAPSAQTFDLDPDGDGIGNGLEAWFGTHPGQFNQGINQLSSDGTSTTFLHPRNTTPPADIAGRYEWSTNLTDWYLADGVAGPVGGGTVATAASTVGNVTTVAATASTPNGCLFLRSVAVRN